MSHYYSEFDPAAAHVLRHLIKIGVLPAGDVDDRSIKEVQPDDLRGYAQCHFFAGGGFWAIAARNAGWPDERPLWSASCPCQPFSVAGKGGGTDDPRHLWPDVLRLARARRPAVLVGEQVAQAAGLSWFDGVRSDLEASGYAARAVDIPALTVNAPHKRNRIYWIARDLADTNSGRRSGRSQAPKRSAFGGTVAERIDASGNMADTAVDRWQQGAAAASIARHRHQFAAEDGLADTATQGEGWRQLRGPGEGGREDHQRTSGQSPGPHDGNMAGHKEPRWENGVGLSLGDGETYSRHRSNDGCHTNYWHDAEWIVCHDGKARRAKPGLRLLAHGLPGRMDLWRIAGNAIVPQAAQEVIAAFIDVYGLPEPYDISTDYSGAFS